MKNYYLNCFLLLLPVLLWNFLLTGKLPPNYQPGIFSKDIPAFLLYGENISRLIIFLLAFVTPLAINTRRQKIGLYIYLAGLLLYMASWAALIYLPGSSWSNSMLGFSAPAITPAVWLTGICLTGNSFSFNVPFKRWPSILSAAVFLAFHISHTVLVYYKVNSYSLSY